MLWSREAYFNVKQKKMTDVACFRGQHFSYLEGI